MKQIPQEYLNAAIVFENVRKTFGVVVANNDVSFVVQPGTITGVLGENGAGKSTAMKILFGLYQADSGRIWLHGERVHWHSPLDAIGAGVGMVHQHFMLIETATALENIVMGQEPAAWGLPSFLHALNLINKKKAFEDIQVIMDQYGLHVPLDTLAGKLPVGLQQRVEILKLLYRKANVLILDEPTAVLTPPEVDVLFENLAKLKAEGKTILVVTHKLREALQFCDTLMMFRQGRMVHTMAAKDATESIIAGHMVDRQIDLHPDIAPCQKVGDEVLRLDGVTLLRTRFSTKERAVLSDINLQVRKGEIVGIAGVEGNGQSELLDLLFHPQRYFGKNPNQFNQKASGKVHLLGENITHKRRSQISHLTVGLIPEDRHSQGLLLDMDARDNYILGRHFEKAFMRFGIFQHKARINHETKLAMEEYDVRPRRVRTPLSAFSGGNQQKLIIAREIGKHSQFIVASNPTRGVDIGAIAFIHDQLVAARDRGVGILLVSAELDEVMTLADRILVIYGGRIVASFKRGEADDRTIGLAMCGGHVES